jgi:urease accessory protein
MLQTRSWLPRTEGSLRLAFRRRDEQTVLDVLHQAGAARARFPKPATGQIPEAVLLNTAGGLTGGDRFDLAMDLAAGAALTATTAAAEKIYRARDGEATIRLAIALEPGADLAWLPQATILFDAARLDRRTEVHLAADARFLGVEILVFGRAAMGEDVHRGYCRDAWRVWRDGKLVLADTLRIDGAIAATLDRPAALGGGRATAFVVYVAPDAPARLEMAQTHCAKAQGTAGASSWNGLLVVRAYAGDGHTLQRDIAPLLEALAARPLPRVWQC